MERKIPWHQRTVRWMQTNLTETDPVRCRIEDWEEIWEENEIQGIIVNAAGIVAYYPSENPLQYRARTLGNRDLLGEFTEAAHRRGMAVLARMDINRADERFYHAHPDWFTIDAEGNPYRTNDGRYYSCVNGGYYREHVPDLLREIIRKYHPEGFTDNSWAGMGKDKICYCPACREKFLHDCGMELPRAADFDDPVYRRWILWSLDCRTEIWDLFNRITTEQDPDCLWLGMMNVNPAAPYFCNLLEISRRAPIVFSDYQSRDEYNGFEQNGIYGGVLSGLTGYDKIHPESIANYVRGRRVFRLCANPAAETQLWLAEGISGQLSPWLHFIGGAPEDKRYLTACRSLMQWHRENERYLYHREPCSTVALLWSQENSLFYGRDQVHERMELPWRGFTRALTADRILYQPMNVSQLDPDSNQYRTVILPDLAVLTDDQAERLCRFIKNGGSIVLTGVSGFLDGTGALRKIPALDEILRLHHPDPQIPPLLPQNGWMDETRHTYLRLAEDKGPVCSGFGDTAILPFGGMLCSTENNGGYRVEATWIPPFPIYPPELACMDPMQTDQPVILCGETGYGGRMVYFAGDIDRCCGETSLPDHKALLAKAVRYAAGELPLTVQGPGYLDCRMYHQKDRFLLHILNLSAGDEMPSYLTEFLPVTGITVSLRTPFCPRHVFSTVDKKDLPFSTNDGWTTIKIPCLSMQEFLIIE